MMRKFTTHCRNFQCQVETVSNYYFMIPRTNIYQRVDTQYFIKPRIMHIFIELESRYISFNYLNLVHLGFKSMWPLGLELRSEISHEYVCTCVVCHAFNSWPLSLNCVQVLGSERIFGAI